MSAHIEHLDRAAVRDPAILLWTVAGLSWTATVLLILVGDAKVANHDYIFEHSTLPWPGRIAAFLLIWMVMISAMMLPTTVRMARLAATVTARAPHPAPARAALASSYLAVWAGFGLVALAGDRSIHYTVDHWPWLSQHTGVILAGTLGLAGAFQFSSLKDRCLTECRDPAAMLWRHYGRGPRKAWRLGLAHAMNCLGCCWAMMLLMFAVGVGGLFWMLLLTALMVAEKTTRWGRRLVVPLGLCLLAAAAVIGTTTLAGTPIAVWH
jgi:predicted metal-binding membrane protein